MKLDADGNLDVNPGEEQLVAWSWTIGVAAAGACLVALAIVAAERWNWRGIWPSVLLEIGAAVLLAAVLVHLERRIIRTVRNPPSVGTCTLSEPKSRIERCATWNGTLIYACHHTPAHQWDDTGRSSPGDDGRRDDRG